MKMNKILYSILLSVLLLSCTADLEDKKALVNDGDIANAKILNGSNGCIKGKVIVRFDASAESRLAECATRSGATRTGICNVDAILDEIDGCGVEPVFMVTDKNREKVYAGGYHLWYELRFDDECDIEAVATKLAAVNEVKMVQFLHPICRIDAPKVVECGEIESQVATRAATAKIPFNEAYSHYQWSMHNLGRQSEYVTAINSSSAAPIEEADINAVPAWKLCTGDPSIIVAVLDEGVMHSHEDLASNMWVNKAELTGEANVDDDGNGYKDDVYGFNFAYMKGAITWDSDSDSGHGSHVAGIISAVNNNGLGICGIAGGSGKGDGVRLLSVQIFSGGSFPSATNLARAMQYAADCGAHIMQNSWGYKSTEAIGSSGPGNDNSYKKYYSAEAAAIDYFIANGGSEDGPIDGGLVIFAAGNDGAGRPGYPAAYEPCVAVAAFSPSLRPAYYTDYGPGTDIVAPGGESLYNYGAILSTVPPKFAKHGTECYAMMQGTSQACPHVSGVAALGLSYAKKLGKRYTAKEFRSLLLSSTGDIEPYLTGAMSFVDDIGVPHSVNYENYRGKLGAGYIDAYKLLLQIDGTPFKLVQAGENTEVDLLPYFGEGVANAQFVRAEASEEDAAAVGLTIGEYADGKLQIRCEKVGISAVSVTMLVGGGSLEDSSKPYPTEVTRKFVIISKKSVPSNGGWL